MPAIVTLENPADEPGSLKLVVCDVDDEISVSLNTLLEVSDT